MNENPAATAVVRRLYVEAFKELLAAYGLADRVHEARVSRDGKHSESRQSYVSVLSLTAERIGIACILDFDVELLASLHPARANSPEAPVGWHDLEDWCRELNNQLGGRLKNKLVARGCDLILGLPSLLSGFDVSAIVQEGMDTYEAAYESDGRRMVVTLATQIAADVVLLDELPRDTSDVLAEGALALF